MTRALVSTLAAVAVVTGLVVPGTVACAAEPKPVATPAVPSLPLTDAQLAQLRQRADGGKTSAMVMLGIFYSRPGPHKDLAQARSWFEKAANAGDSTAMTLLGLRQQAQGHDAQALQWFTKAAAQGGVNAMTALARLYAEGRGVTKDEKRAFTWTKRAAEAGDGMAAAELGQRYLEGRGTAKNPAAAAQWYRSAAD